MNYSLAEIINKKMNCPVRYVFIFMIMLGHVMSHQPAHSQIHTPHRLEFSASVGNRGTTTEFYNIYDEKITRIDRSADLVFGQIYFKKSERLALWMNYTNGLNPEYQVLAGFDRPQKGVYAGGRALAGPYSVVFEYGYHLFQDSLYQDNLWLDHSFDLPSGVRPRLSSGIGIGNQDRLEWMVQGSVEIPLSRFLSVEPLYVLAKNRTIQHHQSRLGIRSRIRLLEKGEISAGFAQIVSDEEEGRSSIFMFQVDIPFLERHQLQFTLHKNATEGKQTTLVALGLRTGLGKMNQGGN